MRALPVQAKELLQDLCRLLELSVEAARQLCSHTEAMCGDVRELGRTFAMMSRYEEAVQAKVRRVWLGVRCGAVWCGVVWCGVVYI
jgi:hypothetical protein